ncbi:hypothetical protein BTVI_06059 [Pitangus sulphuratus]|nr:hypothetical protein BTVI_06059 [Pitangus sulphuratus]
MDRNANNYEMKRESGLQIIMAISGKPNEEKSNKSKHKVWHLSCGNAIYEYRLGEEVIDSSLAEKDLGILVDKKLNTTQQLVLVVQKDKCILDWIKRDVTSRPREVILPLFSVLMRPQLEWCIQLWGPQHKNDIDMLELVQRKAIKMIRGMEHLYREDRLRDLALFSMEKALGRLHYGLLVP